MDLVRLGLERGETAEAAADAIIRLIEEHGQGGSGFDGVDWPYNNSFLLADGTTGFLLEASGRNWALRRFTDRGSASNHTTIGTEWERLSENCEAHAREQGWWAHDGERFDFASAYRDATTIPPFVSSGRYRATCDAAPEGKPADIGSLKALLRDHYGEDQIYRPGVDPSTEEYFSICMHADSIGQTTASMIVELGADKDELTTCWIALGNPCMSVYLPVFPEADIPAALLAGGKEPSEESAWFRFKRLSELVAKDVSANAQLVFDHWAAYEQQLDAVTTEIAAAVEMGDLDSGCEERTDLLEEFMNEAWAATAEQLDELEAKLS
jgi:dipeptidase